MKSLLTISLLILVFSAEAQVTPRPGDGNTPIRIDSTGPASRDTTGASMIADINIAYNELEKSIETAYAKLIREQKNEINELEEKIKALDEKIKELKEQADKIRKVIKQMEQLIAQLQDYQEKSIASIKKQKQQALIELQKALADKKRNTRSESQEIKLRIEKATRDSLKFIPLRLNKLIIKAN